MCVNICVCACTDTLCCQFICVCISDGVHTQLTAYSRAREEEPADSASSRRVDVTARRSHQGRGDLDLSCPTSKEPRSTGTSMTRAVGRAAEHTHMHVHTFTGMHLQIGHTSGVHTCNRNASKYELSVLLETTGENNPKTEGITG